MRELNLRMFIFESLESFSYLFLPSRSSFLLFQIDGGWTGEQIARYSQKKKTFPGKKTLHPKINLHCCHKIKYQTSQNRSIKSHKVCCIFMCNFLNIYFISPSRCVCNSRGNDESIIYLNQKCNKTIMVTSFFFLLTQK